KVIIYRGLIDVRLCRNGSDADRFIAAVGEQPRRSFQDAFSSDFRRSHHCPLAHFSNLRLKFIDRRGGYCRMWGDNRPLLKSRQNPQSCGFESTTIAEHCGSPTGDWSGGKRTPSARGDECAWGCRGEKARKKQGAMNYLKHANRYGRPQLL